MGRKKLLPGLSVKDGFLRHPFDVEHQVQTSGLVAGRHLTTGHLHDRHNTAYYGIAPSVFLELCARWREANLVAPPEDYTFIDFGAGMGRAMLLAARMGFREVVGVELNPVLAETAQKNIDKWVYSGRAKCPMRMVVGDAAEFVYPAGPCVAYLFNPFRETVLKRLVRRMEHAFAGRAGRLDVLYANDEFREVLWGNPRWTRLWGGDIRLSKEDDDADTEILLNQPDGEYEATKEEPCSIFRLLGPSGKK